MNPPTRNPVIDTVVTRYRDALGAHAATYRNHALRGLAYQTQLLGRAPSDESVLAWAVHDLGIWTAGTWDYLPPSAKLVDEFAAEVGVHDVERAKRLVVDHHKLRRADDEEIETFRLADRVDVSRGLLRSGIPRAEIRLAVRVLPYLGFHRFLARGLTKHAVTHPLRPAPMLKW